MALSQDCFGASRLAMTLISMIMDLNPSRKRLTLSVGELARLASDSADMPSSPGLSLRGRLGAEAHRAYQNQQNRSAAFRQEVHLDVLLPPLAPFEDWEIRLRGRLDGLIEELDRCVIEELKTVVLPAARFQALTVDDFPRHRRQIEIYLFLLFLTRKDKPPAGRLIYLNLPTNRRQSFELNYQADQVEPFLYGLIRYLLQREVRRASERQGKVELAEKIRFPFRRFRLGQHDIIKAINEVLEKGENLLLEAPTGLGKTVAALYAVLIYAFQQDKQVLFLTSKTTQQDLAFRTALAIKSKHRFPRILLLRSRQKLCPLEEECRFGECPYLDDFYDRLRQRGLLDELLKMEDWHADRIQEIGLREKLCPHELQLLLAEEADLIIGDYNYAFDPSVKLARLFEQGDPSRLILIVDEAHNLPERARSYYSPALSWESARAALGKLDEENFHSLDEPFRAIQNQFEYYLSQAPAEPEPHPIQLSTPAWQKVTDQFEAGIVSYWFRLADRPSRGEDDPVLSFYRQLDDFNRILGLESDQFAHLLRRTPSPALDILCLDAAPYLKETFTTVHASIFLSATLQPLGAYSRLLGAEAQQLSLASPFPPNHCRVIIDPSVTTIFRQREANIKAIAEKIQLFHQLVKKNTLVFFPSFEFMRQVIKSLRLRKILMQEEGLSDGQRADLLASFKRSRHALLCCVMGGVFAEGIDLPGRWAEAAILVGVGLPQVNTENELLRAYYERTEQQGFEYTYLYPGVRRAVQAAGRVIRRETDHGIILLLDHRYTRKEYQRLLPQHWFHGNSMQVITSDWESEIREAGFSSTEVAR